MLSAVRWAVRNIPGINIMIVAVLVTGATAFLSMRREVFPEFQLDAILIQVPYPGANPEEVEVGICQKIEEGIQSLSGIKRIVSIAQEGAGFTIAELQSSTDVQSLLADIRSEIDRVAPFFPETAEQHNVEQITFRQPAIRVAVITDRLDTVQQELDLRQVAERIREQLIELPVVSQAEIMGAKPYQIDVEISQQTLQQYGLTLGQIAQILRRENVELPGGQMRVDGGEILLRGKNRRDTGDEIAQLPLLSKSSGAVLTLGDLGKVRDEFDDVVSLSRVNGLPALVINIERTSQEDLLKISDAVQELAATLEVPAGYQLRVWDDTSIDVRDRIRMLKNNGVQGLLLVFVVLAIFLDLRLAFWVALGIPICVLGAGGVLLLTGQTLNMLSMFAFLMALGIVVDDAIVVGENIYTHRLMEKTFYQASIDGVLEVLPSVTSAVMTTVVAMMPLFFVAGVMGKFIAVMPVAIIAMLGFSLLESFFALPGHLAHENDRPKSVAGRLLQLVSWPLKPLLWLFHAISLRAERALEWVAERIYRPALSFCLSYPTVPIAIAIALLVTAVSLTRSGVVPFNAFPKLDGNRILAKITYPDGTAAEVTDQATRVMETAILQITEEVYQKDLLLAGRGQGAGSAAAMRLVADAVPQAIGERLDMGLDPRGPVKLVFRQVGAQSGGGGLADMGGGSGSHLGQVTVELLDASERRITSQELINRWRAASGSFPGAERVVFQAADIGPGGNPIEFKVLLPRQDQHLMRQAVEMCKEQLQRFAGVFDIRDDSSPGKVELQFRIKDQAQAIGITAAELAETIRHAYYGAEVMRLQRGRHEVKLVVRYPREQRRSMTDFSDIRVRGADGVERPILELADITVSQGYSEINRLDQMRSVTVTADVDEAVANAREVIAKLKREFEPQLAEVFPAARIRWEGQQQQTQESLSSLWVGFSIALLVMYVLLVLQFRSYFQPVLILVIIPFGVIGAIFGHALMGLPMTLFSMFGLVALTGVVVNDSIVLVDFINQRVRGGMEFRQALLEAGQRRLRPIFLTSITTVAGLFPMLIERSMQAQVLIPMAVSLAFGLMMATLLVLFQIPVMYLLYLNIAIPFGVDPTEALLEDRQGEASRPAQTPSPVPQGA